MRYVHSVYLAADTDVRLQAQADGLVVERAVKVDPNGFFALALGRAQAYLHVKFHGGYAGGYVRHLREQTEHRLRSDQHLQFGGIDVDIVFKAIAVGKRLRLHAAHSGSKRNGISVCGEFEAVVSVAQLVERVNGDIVAGSRLHIVRTAYLMSGGLLIILVIHIFEQHFLPAFRRVFVEIDGFKLHIVADIVKGDGEVHAALVCGNFAFLFEITHTVVIVIHIGNSVFKLSEIAHNKAGKIEVLHLVNGQRDTQNGDGAEVNHQRVFTDRYGDGGVLFDDKAVARHHIAGLGSVGGEGHALGEGNAHHKAAVRQIFFVKGGVNAQRCRYLGANAVAAHRPGEAVAQVFGDVVGQEGSDYLGDVVCARLHVYGQIGFQGNAVGKYAYHAFRKPGAI